ncbi:MAG TPA: right-handed parallel beta-helix repeat-containing protein [Terriglobia bacterium]|nr:right-handed parallel beta-helix repeat-containing protein [Terriglobia bacterium]
MDIENLLLTGGSEGLFVGDGSSVTGVNLKAEGNWYSGITVDNNSSLFVWDGDAIGNGVWGIHAAGSSNVTLSGATEWVTGRPFVVSGNGADGIGADRAVVSILGGVTVEDNVESGIRLNPGTLAMGSYIPAENLIQHNPVGVVIMEGAQASFWGPNTIKENGVGVQAIIGSEVTFYEVVMPAGSVTLVEGNTSSGVEVSSNSAAWFFGHNKILNNGSTTDPLRAGIRVDGTSHALFEGGNEISGNTGPGIVADVNSSLDIWDTTISGNSEEGIRVRHMSIAEVQGSTATAGNGGGPLACDGSSLVISSLFAKTAKCANIEGAPSGPKPRTASMMRVAPNVRFMVQEARRAAERFKAPK